MKEEEAEGGQEESFASRDLQQKHTCWLKQQQCISFKFQLLSFAHKAIERFNYDLRDAGLIKANLMPLLFLPHAAT